LSRLPESANRSVLTDELPAAGTNVFAGSFASPVAVLRNTQLDHNIAAMQQWCTERDVALAPHGKTTLAPALLRRQLAAGAWGITMANPAQARIAASAGATRILIANQVTDAAGMRWLGTFQRDHPEIRLLCYVDSMAGVELLDGALAGLLPGGVALDVLVELGTPGGRTGLRDDGEALELARRVAASDRLRVAGVSGYEGVVGGPADDRGVAAVEEFCYRLRNFASRLADAGLVPATQERPMIVSAGGSVFFDQVTRILQAEATYPVPAEVVLRSGCYVTQDYGMYARLTPAARGCDGPDLRAALEVWGRVLSVPEPGRAILDIGRRDISYDSDLPAVLSRKAPGGGASSPLDATVVALYDQHAFLDLPADTELFVGDWVGLGPSHPCTTFDKWRSLLLIDDSDALLGFIETQF
jgi:D-serine deaminase-like pyridoxal phosphate-dependent protein